MNILKYRYVPYALSSLLILFALFNIVRFGFSLSTEFTGGSELTFKSSLSVGDVNKNLDQSLDYEFKLRTQDDIYVFTTNKDLSENEVENLRNILNKDPNFVEENLSVVKAVIGQELIYKTFIAVGISILVIFVFIAYSFKSVLASSSAILAMIHDTLILLGLFAFFGEVATAKIDLLFVTALLTVLSFSLYDTIVIFDRVRENYKKTSGGYYEVLNLSVRQTMVRSINNSITSILALYSLALFVSGSLFWFALALLIGVVLGTYSSPMVAVPIFYDLQRLTKKLPKKYKRKKPNKKKKKKEHKDKVVV